MVVEFCICNRLLTTDGNLSPDGRHINFTSRDLELAEHLRRCLRITNKIGRKSRKPDEREKKYFVVQFGDVKFYKFLMSIGFLPKKSRTLEEIKTPDKYFFDFLRGCFDGDGTFYSYWDPRWKSSYMFYTVFASASHDHIDWLKNKIYKRTGAKGHITKAKMKTTFQLKYAKTESLRILSKMYYGNGTPCLSRKRLKINKSLSIIKEKI